jgi:hypothetical protein
MNLNYLSVCLECVFLLSLFLSGSFTAHHFLLHSDRSSDRFCFSDSYFSLISHRPGKSFAQADIVPISIFFLHVVYSCSMRMETIGFSETSVHFLQTRIHKIPEDSNYDTLLRNCTSHIIIAVCVKRKNLIAKKKPQHSKFESN